MVGPSVLVLAVICVSQICLASIFQAANRNRRRLGREAIPTHVGVIAACLLCLIVYVAMTTRPRTTTVFSVEEMMEGIDRGDAPF